MIKIFDNIIPKKKQEELKNLLLGNNFPWYFVADITHLGNKTQSRPGHSHLFYEYGKSNSHLSNEVNIISDKVNKKIKKNLSIEQVRSFLQLPLNEKLLYKCAAYALLSQNKTCNLSPCIVTLDSFPP